MRGNKMLTIFHDTFIQDLKYLFETNDEPILVLRDNRSVLGLIDPNDFWKQMALNMDIEYIGQFLTQSYNIYEHIDEIHYQDTYKYTYAIIYDNHEYFWYNMKDLQLFKLQNELNGLSFANKSFIEKLEQSKKLNKEFKQILNASYDEIFVTDAEGNTLFVSDAVKKLTSLPPDAYIGKNIKELAEKGMVVNSVTLKTMESKKIHSSEQSYTSGITVFSTSTPIFNEHGQLYRIVTNSRDISELVEMRERLRDINKTPEKNVEINQVFYYGGLITITDSMLSIIHLTKKIAKTDSSILINGESGVGKGVLAKMIHNLSERNRKQFVQVNCGAIPSTLIESELFGYESGAFTGATNKGKKGLVELANGGTLFLDEVGEMPLDMQVKLLHLVQEKKYMKVGGTKLRIANIRIISATNRDLKQLIAEGKFREDLYYRLHVVPLTIPPLRERKNDILILIDYFLYKYNKKHKQNVSFDHSSKLFLQLHHYHGNVRELENLIEQLVLTASTSVISTGELSNHLHSDKIVNQDNQNEPLSLKETIENAEQQLLIQTLDKYNTTRQLADALNVSQTTIMRKLNKYGLSTK